MTAHPVYCEHGRIVAWDVIDAMPDDPVPSIEHCEVCNPDAEPLVS